MAAIQITQSLKKFLNLEIFSNKTEPVSLSDRKQSKTA